MAQRLKIGSVVGAASAQWQDVIDLRCCSTACSAHRLLSQHHETPSRPGAVVSSRCRAGSRLGCALRSRQVVSRWSMLWDSVGHYRLLIETSTHARGRGNVSISMSSPCTMVQSSPASTSQRTSQSRIALATLSMSRLLRHPEPVRTTIVTCTG